MATGNLVKNFSDEATCSICLEYFKAPVTVDCGHNFCQACITQCLEKVEAGPCCPQCRETISQRNFRPSRQLTNLVELVKKLQQEMQEEQKRGVCGKHQEPLKLFCKEDRMSICVVCHLSKEHKTHNVLPLDEASEEYKEKMMNQIPSLMKKRQELKALCADEEEKSQKSLAHVKKEKEKILSAFEQLQKALEERKCSWLSWLDDLEKKMKENREENGAELLNQITDLSSLVDEILKKCQQPTSEFLQDIADVLDRYGSAEERKPVLKPWTFEQTLNLWTHRREALETTVKDCEESLKKSSEKVIVTLDPDTAHPSLVISEDRSSAKKENCDQRLPFKPERFDTMWCVLGCEKFMAGRHCWDVELKEHQAGWVVGVAQESVKRTGIINFRPEEGIWAVQSCHSTFNYPPPFQSLSFTSLSQTIINSPWKLSKIRVSLDYEAGHVAFSDVYSGRSVFTFSSACFAGERVCPIFWVPLETVLNCC
uniref:Zinc finger protein RFP-like n=1 Tax=Salvator merianae TaxID=96440 RepID=A0A8D0BR89_SALMN